MPDYECVYREMQRKGVTLNLLWLEYVEKCRLSGDVPYQSTQFNKYYGEYVAKHSATMHLNHNKPGEIIIEARHKVASTIFCSQFSVRGWQDKIGDPILADAIYDRIVHDSYSLLVEGKESMRKRKGIPEDT